jgi:hypothetical protein
LLALVIMVAAQQSKVTPTDANSAAMGALPLGDGVTRAPDISAMSPRERADRLYNRVMTLSSQGKADSAAFFASMAVQVYPELAPFDLDLRYDYGRIAEMAGELSVAGAQADSILAEHPDHLLGLILSARVAQAKGDAKTAKAREEQLVRVEKVERAKSLDEYQRHGSDIDAALATLRK